MSVKSTLQPVLRRNLIIDQLVKDKRYSLFAEIANRECKFLHKIFKKSSVKYSFSGMAGRGFSALIAGKGVKTSVIFPSFFRHLANLSSKLIRHFKISDVKQLGQAVCFAAMGVMCTMAAVPARLVFAAHLAPCGDSQPGEYKKYTPGLRVLQNATCAAQLTAPL